MAEIRAKDDDSLDEKLRSAGEDELAALLAAHRDRLDRRAARLVFRNPFLSGPLIEELVALPALASDYEVRRETAFHPRTPRLLALRFVGVLFWSDLLKLGVDTRVHPIVRRAADLRLIERLAGLAVGEKVVVGRGASAAVIASLRQDPSPRVVAALLENPRLTEGLLMPLAAGERSAPQVLALLASSPRWGGRPALRYALCRNPATPIPSALAMLPMLAKRELEAVAHDPRLAASVRRRAEVLSGVAASPGSR